MLTYTLGREEEKRRENNLKAEYPVESIESSGSWDYSAFQYASIASVERSVQIMH
ncbi:hypothetical protein AGMMS50262_22160 [Bacteroidia bacterium]|nr:hypothetical protein AGMMS50262_22160 [Bacteroidia bacterium]